MRGRIGPNDFFSFVIAVTPDVKIALIIASIFSFPFSVTRLLGYLFKNEAFTKLKYCPKAYQIYQNKLKMFPNTK